MGEVRGARVGGCSMVGPGATSLGYNGRETMEIRAGTSELWI